jgi:hypothetical protein
MLNLKRKENKFNMDKVMKMIIRKEIDEQLIK